MIEGQDGLPAGVAQSLPGRWTAPSLAVAIGAADGGIDPLQEFFIALEDEGGIVYLVQHVDRFGASGLVELLARFTELPVTTIRPGDRLEPDHVFVAPPGVAVTIESSAFVLERSEPNARGRSLDALFGSIAAAFGERAAGIVLSGEGVDGTRGARRIARAGGIVLAQEPALAKRDGMLRSAIASGAIDRVALPFAMPALLQARRRLLDARSTSARRIDAQQTIRELRADNDELSRLNRELLAIHGRLHWTVEGLRSALAESRAQTDALSSAHSRLRDMLSHASIAMLFLDEQARVQGFSGDATKIFAIDASDLGKPFDRLEHHAHEMPPLPSPTQLRMARAQEEDVITDDRWYLRRVLPQFTSPGRLSGAVVTFVDVTALKIGEGSATPHEARSLALTSVVSDVYQAIARSRVNAR